MCFGPSKGNVVNSVICADDNQYVFLHLIPSSYRNRLPSGMYANCWLEVAAGGIDWNDGTNK